MNTPWLIGTNQPFGLDWVTGGWTADGRRGTLARMAQTGDVAVQRLRALCLALPETSERLSHGEPTFFIRGKRSFVSIDDHHHGADHLAFWCAAPPGAQQELIAEDPERFFRPAYVGNRGWIGVRIDRVQGREPDWDEIGEIVREAYRQVAPKALAARLDTTPA